MKKEIKTKKITRVEVIDENGRAYVGNDLVVTVSIQDDGRTMKVFVRKQNDNDKH